MRSIAACTARAVAGATFRVRLTTCETVETETPASRATSAIVATPPPEWCAPSFAPGGVEPGLCDKVARRNVCAIVYMRLFGRTTTAGGRPALRTPSRNGRL